MRKLRKTLGNFDDPKILSLARLAETQSKRTLCLKNSIANSIGIYSEEHLGIAKVSEHQSFLAILV